MNTQNEASPASTMDEVSYLERRIRVLLQHVANLLTFNNLVNARAQAEQVHSDKPAQLTRNEVLVTATLLHVLRALNDAGRAYGYTCSLHGTELSDRAGKLDAVYTLLTPTALGDLVKVSVEKEGFRYLHVAPTAEPGPKPVLPTADVDRSEVTPRPECLWDKGHIQATLDELAANKVDRLGAELRAHNALSLPTPTPVIIDRAAAELEASTDAQEFGISEAAAQDIAERMLPTTPPKALPEEPELYSLSREEQARALLEPHKIRLNPYLLGLNLKPIDVNTLDTQGRPGSCQGYATAPASEAAALATGDIDHKALSAILGSTYEDREADDDTTELEMPDTLRQEESVYLEAVSKIVLNVGLWSHGRGWWSDLETGEYLGCNYPAGERPKGSKAVGDQIALIHTEVSEAYEGDRKGKPDEHCPEFMSLEVELADAFIRIADMAYGMKLRLPQAVAAKMAYNQTRADHSKKARQAEGGKKS
jgi:hypothetical protein